MKYTRQQYLNKECTHDQYYSQFVTEQIKNLVEQTIGIDRLKKSEDDSFNDVTALIEWDSLGYRFNNTDLNKKMKECGDYTTLGGLVCVGKSAARLLLKGINND